VRRRSAGVHLLGVQLMLWLYAAVAFGPVALVLIGSLRSNKDILAQPLGLPNGLETGNYRRAWQTASLSTYFLNSVLVSIGAVVLCVAVSAMAAYPLARWRFRGRAVLSAYFLSGLMLPVKLGVLPIFYMFQSMDLIDSRTGLILLYAAGGIPFSVFVLTAFVRSLPVEPEEAARIDGASEGAVFRSVVLPLVRPAIATVAVFQFAPTWNDFFFPLVLLRSDERYTIPVGLTRFFGEYSIDRGALYAGLVLAVLPLAMLFVVASRQVVAGLTSGIGR
jgi:raffinose/stachyose/melibiose transport system permease protein